MDTTCFLSHTPLFSIRTPVVVPELPCQAQISILSFIFLWKPAATSDSISAIWSSSNVPKHHHVTRKWWPLSEFCIHRKDTVRSSKLPLIFYHGRTTFRGGANFAHALLVKLIKLKRTESLCTLKERKREKKREKIERKQCFFHFFAKKKTSRQNKNTIQ